MRANASILAAEGPPPTADLILSERNNATGRSILAAEGPPPTADDPERAIMANYFGFIDE